MAYVKYNRPEIYSSNGDGSPDESIYEESIKLEVILYEIPDNTLTACIIGVTENGDTVYKDFKDNLSVEEAIDIINYYIQNDEMITYNEEDGHGETVLSSKHNVDNIGNVIDCTDSYVLGKKDAIKFEEQQFNPQTKIGYDYLVVAYPEENIQPPDGSDLTNPANLDWD